MNNKMKKHIADGFDQIAVNVFADVMKNIEIEQSSGQITSGIEHERVTRGEERKRIKTGYPKRRRIVATACAILMVVCGTGVYFNTALKSYAAEIYIDANPSLVMEVNKDRQVTKIKAGNDSAKDFARNIRRSVTYPISVESAVNIAIDGLESEGYISGEEMDTVISYCYKGEPDGDVINEIDSAASQSLKEGSYVLQDFKDDKKLERTAHDNGITPGKCYYIESLAKDHEMTVETCARKSITEISKEADKADNGKSANDKNKKSSKVKESVSAQSQSSRHSKVKENTSESKSSVQKETVVKKEPEENASSIATSEVDPEATHNKPKAKKVTVVATSCTSDGIIRVHFSQRVHFSKDLKIIVTDSEGQIIKARLIGKKQTFIKLHAFGVSEGSTYNVTIAGVKGNDSHRYRSVTTAVTVRNAKQ